MLAHDASERLLSLFDAYIMVDWSANSSPCRGKNSVWIGHWQRGAEQKILSNPRTRQSAIDELVVLLRSHVASGRSALIGFDFPYGYPTGFADAAGLIGSALPWRRTWHMLQQEIRDEEHNGNNRFEVAAKLNGVMGGPPGPFWGCPAGTAGVLETKSIFPHVVGPNHCLAEYRWSEVRLRNNGRGVHSVWQLWTAGNVGSQALTGIPRLSTLRDHPDLAAHSWVWPFETGFRPDPTNGKSPCIIHAEIWPGAVQIDHSLHPTNDASQVLSLINHFAALDDRGKLGSFFGVRESLVGEALADCLKEEGWILGV